MSAPLVCSYNMFDSLICALKTTVPPSTPPITSLEQPLSTEPSYEQFPYDKAILLNTHQLIFHSQPQQHDPLHVAFSTSTSICFNVLPRSRRHLQENEFIWHVVNSRSLTVPIHLQGLLSPLCSVPNATAFALAVPQKLAMFLRQVSLEDMSKAIVDMVADAFGGETAEGMLHMRSILDPTVWEAVAAVLHGHARPTASSERAGALLDFVMESCVPEDGWTIQVTVGLTGPPALPFLGGVVLQSMNDDWMLYRRYIRNLRLARATMQNLTRQGRQAEVWERARAVLLCTSFDRSYLSLLPTQVVESVLIPWLLFSEGCGVRRERINTLTSREEDL